MFPGIWDPDEEPDQWRRLADYLIRASPLTIAINTSDADALADGMTATEMRALRAALPQPLAERITPADDLAIRWLATRGASEVAAYPDICATAHGFLQRALSREVIDPGKLTWVVVGDLGKIEDGVRSLNYGEVEVWDAFGNKLR